MNEIDCEEELTLSGSPGETPRITESHLLNKGLPLQLSGSWGIRKALLVHFVPEPHYLSYGPVLEASTSIRAPETDHAY